MKFSYRRYQIEPRPIQPKLSVIHRPVIPVRIMGSKRSAVFYGLLDSGADETILPRAMAELIGLEVDLSLTATALSASGQLTVDYAPVTFELKKGTESYRWKTLVGIADQDWQEAVLGRLGFLQYFDATFFDQQRTVLLNRNKRALP